MKHIYYARLFSEAVVQRCSVKKVLEILQNSQENTCARVSFLIKLQALRPDTFSYRTPLVAAFLFSKRLNFLLVARCSLVLARCSLLFARCSLLFACCSLLFARCSLLFARYFLLVACYFLLVAYFSLIPRPISYYGNSGSALTLSSFFVLF